MIYYVHASSVTLYSLGNAVIQSSLLTVIRLSLDLSASVSDKKHPPSQEGKPVGFKSKSTRVLSLCLG